MRVRDYPHLMVDGSIPAVGRDLGRTFPPVDPAESVHRVPDAVLGELLPPETNPEHRARSPSKAESRCHASCYNLLFLRPYGPSRAR